MSRFCSTRSRNGSGALITSATRASVQLKMNIVMRTATITRPLTTQAMPPHLKNWLSVSTSEVTRLTSAPRRSSAWSRDREPVDVAERPGPQTEQRVLARTGEPARREHRGDRGDDRDHRAGQREGQHPSHIDLSVVEPLVDHLLHEDGDHDAAGCTDEREADGAPDALSELGARTPASAHDREDRVRLPLDGGIERIGGHRPARSFS